MGNRTTVERNEHDLVHQPFPNNLFKLAHRTSPVTNAYHQIGSLNPRDPISQAERAARENSMPWPNLFSKKREFKYSKEHQMGVLQSINRIKYSGIWYMAFIRWIEKLGIRIVQTEFS